MLWLIWLILIVFAVLIKIQLNACLQNATVSTLGASTGTINNLCVPQVLKVGNLKNCGLYRASATYSAATNYTLGSFLAFDTELDDPNNN